MSTIVTTNIQSDTIKHSGGTTAMTIDSVGRVKNQQNQHSTLEETEMVI